MMPMFMVSSIFWLLDNSRLCSIIAVGMVLLLFSTGGHMRSLLYSMGLPLLVSPGGARVRIWERYGTWARAQGRCPSHRDDLGPSGHPLGQPSQGGRPYEREPHLR